MCQYCERRTDIKHGWNQPKLCDENWKHPSDSIQDTVSSNLNVNGKPDWEARIYDYQTSTPKLIITSKNIAKVLWGDGTATIYIPIHYCPVCGRKLGNAVATDTNVGNNGWIPVRERLPNEEEMKQAYCRNHYGSEFIVMIAGANKSTTLYRTMDGFWVDEKREAYKVLAWQALPEPYVGEKHDGN